MVKPDALRGSNYITVDARLGPSVDRWADCRYPIQDQAEVLRGRLAPAPRRGVALLDDDHSPSPGST